MLSPDAAPPTPLWLIVLRRKRPKMAVWYDGGSPHLGLTRARAARNKNESHTLKIALPRLRDGVRGGGVHGIGGLP